MESSVQANSVIDIDIGSFELKTSAYQYAVPNMVAQDPADPDHLLVGLDANWIRHQLNVLQPV